MLDVTLPADGEYLVRIFDTAYAGSIEHFYRLTVHAGPHVDFAMPASIVPGSTAEVTPAIIPDLFAGDSLRLMGRFNGSRQATVTIRGNANGRPARLPVRVTLSDAPSEGPSPIPIVWARGQVGDLMRDYTAPAQLRTSGLSQNELEARVTELGLEFALVTDWTSFVAVSRRVVNASPGAAVDADAPLPMPEGVRPGAYGEGYMTAQFGGSSAPEPGVMALLALLLTGVAFAMARRVRT